MLSVVLLHNCLSAYFISVSCEEGEVNLDLKEILTAEYCAEKLLVNNPVRIVLCFVSVFA